jgi:hypothetical protein
VVQFSKGFCGDFFKKRPLALRNQRRLLAGHPRPGLGFVFVEEFGEFA